MRPSRQGSGRPRRPGAAEPRGAAGPDGPNGPRATPFRRKSLGQHHLKSGRTCQPLLDFLRLAPGDHVLEIGPGGGILTAELLNSGARVVALELDPAWAFVLPKRAATFRDRDSAKPNEPRSLEEETDDEREEAPRLEILLADALEFPWERLGAGWRIAGNLPYNVGTAIVERMLRGARPGMRAAFLLQREVVDRIVARPGDEAYGALSVLVAARARAVRLGTVKPGAFVPPPKVESAFVGLETIASPLSEAELPGFERVVKAAFGQRRKSLRNALASAFGRERAAAMLAAAAIDPGRRAEALELAEFVGLSRSGAAVGAFD